MADLARAGDQVGVAAGFVDEEDLDMVEREPVADQVYGADQQFVLV